MVRDVSELLEAARDGCEDAVQELFDHYRGHFLKVIRRKMGKRLRTILDSEDFLQDVRLFLVSRNVDPGAFDSPAAFVAYLSRMSKNQVGELNRKYLQRQKHNLNREVPLRDGDNGLAGSEERASEAVAAREKWDRWMDGLSPRDKTIFDLLRQSLSPRQIAERLRLDEKTIRRAVDRLQATV